MMKITGADHTSYTVSDLERSLHFYIDLLGMQLLWRRQIEDAYFCEIIGFLDCRVHAAHLRIPGSDHHLELFEYVDPSGERTELRSQFVGSSHLSLLVDDLQAAYAELSAKGVQFRSQPVLITHGANKGGWGLYLLDPDGITIELFQRAAPASDPTDTDTLK